MNIKASPLHNIYLQKMIKGLEELCLGKEKKSESTGLREAVRARVLHSWQGVMAASLLDLGVIHDELESLYRPGNRGIKRYEPTVMFRSLLLMMALGPLSFRGWPKSMEEMPERRILAGFEQGRFAQKSAYYMYCKRLLNGPYQERWAQEGRPSDALEGRGASFLRSLEREKDLAKEELKAAKLEPDERRVEQTLRIALETEQSGCSWLPALVRRMNELLWRCAIIPSLQLPFLQDFLSELRVSVDSSAIKTQASSHGKRAFDTCLCHLFPQPEEKGKKKKCTCPRFYSDPEATWGYDSKTESYFFGHRLHAIVVRTEERDLPLYVNVTDAHTPDAVVAVDMLLEFHDLCDKNNKMLHPDDEAPQSPTCDEPPPPTSDEPQPPTSDEPQPRANNEAPQPRADEGVSFSSPLPSEDPAASLAPGTAASLAPEALLPGRAASLQEEQSDNGTPFSSANTEQKSPAVSGCSGCSTCATMGSPCEEAAHSNEDDASLKRVMEYLQQQQNKEQQRRQQRQHSAESPAFPIKPPSELSMPPLAEILQKASFRPASSHSPPTSSQQLPKIHINIGIFDKAYDAEAFYELLHKLDCTPIIPLRNPPEFDHNKIPRDKKGTPLCPAGIPMKLHGCNNKRKHLVYHCPAKYLGRTNGKHTWKVREGVCPRDELCDPNSTMGPFYYLPFEENRRLNTPIPRSSELFAEYTKDRTSVERYFSQLLSRGFFDRPFRRRYLYQIMATFHSIFAFARAWIWEYWGQQPVRDIQSLFCRLHAIKDAFQESEKPP